jgi:hypothetical protein
MRSTSEILRHHFDVKPREVFKKEPGAAILDVSFGGAFHEGFCIFFAVRGIPRRLPDLLKPGLDIYEDFSILTRVL